MLLDKTATQIIVIDVQTKLVSVMPEEIQSVIQRSACLLKAAKLFEIPALGTLQYRGGLGEFVPEIKELIDISIEKTSFSCMAEPLFRERLLPECSQIVLIGLETHICILQTALALKVWDKQVFVVSDAVLSRKNFLHQNALLRLQQAGVILISSESVLFEWVRDAKNEHFKTISTWVKAL